MAYLASDLDVHLLAVLLQLRVLILEVRALGIVESDLCQKKPR